MQIKLPAPDGALVDYRLTGTPLQVVKPTAPFNRIAYSAAHVVADPLRSGELGQACTIDWERTIEYRRYLLEQGLGIAEAMDTAQRGMGLSWESAKDLIVRTLNETRDIPGARIASGCGTDHLPVSEARSCEDVINAYLTQIDSVQRAGGQIILMASRALARVAKDAGDYIRVYREVLSACDQPVILHWLGEAFDPELAGYWGHVDFESAAQVCLEVIDANEAKVDGIKISLLDDAKEIAFRRRLPQSVKMYTGDDFNYPVLIAGDEFGYSHALLGIFDSIAPAASQALAALAANDRARYDELLAPTVPLSRHIFRAPTQYYKTGVVLLAYLNGFQPHFFMLGGQHGMRPPIYLAEVFRLADQANLLRDPELATARMQRLMTTLGCAG
ncbi:dihydrodipicolinate synthase family protein [Paraburkholderia phenoliruptrix]|uniref:Dihydrodipicolinate synthase family protein n=2 Tax=Paraburkholderia phenoliruptrix TaxID=252970 RepID=K0DQB4_9BURK|nr:dihydrodipicolinate synthase family protein [Paraburkholderia phenoliruptrix]AFT86118.1 hypothetical protein BUPH_02549 [Paraburkholderia phenoliruptrix BR3459a]CAB4048666.1 hypothetical protein LMG9964_02307 [Paraburkholderia phenoliruptrix]